MKKTFLIILAAVVLFSFLSCKRKEEQKPVPQQSTSAPRGPIVDSPLTPPPGHGTPGQGQKVEFQVVVPPEVSAKWSGVKFIVEDRKENKKLELTAPVGSELKIPDSNLVVKVGPFLPDFKMNGPVITSASNEMTNPAVGVTVLENGSQIFPAPGGTAKWGWLYQKFPAVHAFQHERFALALKEGIQK
ncbi:MAG: hypothetical protein HY808_06250 [Nitrospirae bacterium]|nr:hypothetical protein [Nitrospirota bacterium]